MSEAPDDQEGTPEQPTETPEQPTPPARWAGKYETPEDLEQAYKDLQAKLGEQGNELGELRKLRDEFEQLRQRLSAPTIDDETWDQVADENPQQAVMLALQHGDALRYQQAMRAWFEVDPYEATEFRLNLERQQMAAVQQQQLSRYEEQLANQQLAQAERKVRSRYDDYDRMEPFMVKAAELAPHLLEPLKNGTVQAKEQVIESLYWMGRGLAGGEPAAAGTEQQVPHVASATSVPSNPATTNVDPILEAFDAAAERLMLRD